jgi:thiamine phosphate synthase YjbQ (UPF0047 family)
MTSIETPQSVAAALPSLLVLDITEEVARELAAAEVRNGIAYLIGAPGTVIRAQERETGLFCDVEELLGRFVPADAADRTRHLSLLLGSGAEQIPFVDGKLCLGQWQRIMLFDLEGRGRGEWTLSLVG